MVSTTEVNIPISELNRLSRRHPDDEGVRVLQLTLQLCEIFDELDKLGISHMNAGEWSIKKETETADTVENGT